jgi:preprotein translocase subunit SecD
MRHIWWVFLGIVVLAALAAYTDLPNSPGYHFLGLNRSVTVQKGLDLAGGVRVLLCAKGHPSSSDMQVARDVIENRASGGFGVTEPQVSVVGNNCISAELPSVKNPSLVIKTLGSTGQLVLGDSGTVPLAPGTRVKLTTKGPSNPIAKPEPIIKVIVPGRYVVPGSAQIQYDQTGNPTVVYSLRGAGSTAWCNYTSANVGKYSPIILDNRVVSDPQIKEAICGGQTQITFPPGTTVDSPNGPNQIKIVLNYGALPVSLHVNSSEQVSATLGPQYVHKATIAGIVGLLLVALFMLLYYRLPGALADVALLLYAAVVFAIFKIIPVTLTLAGIAGFILSIGMAVDANVLIFERMKEELRAGKTLGAAIEAGFGRAWPSIRDSNVSTMITTAILFWFGQHFGTTIITGFATTLFIGVVISMFTAITVTRTFLRMLVASGRFRSLGLYGVTVQEMPARAVGGEVA